MEMPKMRKYFISSFCYGEQIPIQGQQCFVASRWHQFSLEMKWKTHFWHAWENIDNNDDGYDDDVHTHCQIPDLVCSKIFHKKLG